MLDIGGWEFLVVAFCADHGGWPKGASEDASWFYPCNASGAINGG